MLNYQHELELLLDGRHPGTKQVGQFFTYEHLPDHLQEVSMEACRMAFIMVGTLEDGPELTTGLRKLLEAKDCFVRSAVATAS